VGPQIDEYSVLAANAVVLPGVTIGKHCLIGASSVVTKDVKDYSVSIGNPAKYKGDIRTVISRETGKPHYPWPNNFERAMPWKGVKYEDWVSLENHFKRIGSK
jgi:serine acetyltransferase